MAKTSKNDSTQMNEQTPEASSMTPSLLVGYVRRSNAGGAIKLSINSHAFGDCET